MKVDQITTNANIYTLLQTHFHSFTMGTKNEYCKNSPLDFSREV